ncbi:hypothetical protein INS49_007478 [Diaporthe citri]|uniref:uncharacterized protein n=1 Tax=Diaporthe citri TaxID=83186 RepID=UPI001C81F480|nr:uncharacterized protein INS49_007478 [Diaporthe citri]KAG6353396.1 hypothetical protein INS49_007478 [Diaporthe citri]
MGEDGKGGEDSEGAQPKGGTPSAAVESPSIAGSCAHPEAEMANERRLNKSAARTPRHGSSSTTTTTTAGSSNSSSSGGSSSTVNAASGGKKQSSRQYRLPHPPVPHAQTSLLQSQRVPASVVAYPSARQVGYESPQLSDSRYYASGGRGGGLATTATTTTAAAGGLAATAAEATDGSTEAAVPSADPDVMEAKKGLNKWGAFDSLSGSGTGTFGFGPLLFHHVDETPRDPYDTTNMMLNDPISFNPMSAISWARLDDSPDSIDELEDDLSSTARQPDMAIAAAAAGASGSRRDGSSSRAGYVESPASTTASPRHGSGASYASDVSDSRTSSVAGSSVGNISRTFSDTSLAQTTTDLLLCLGPHCSARFPTEQELAAHYRAEHAFTCTWTSCSAASFTSSNALAWHVNAEHRLMCPVPGCCGATFGSKRALDGHLKGEVVTSSGSAPSGSSSAATPRKHAQQQQPQPQLQSQQQQPPPPHHHQRARRRSKSPSFSPGHRPPQRTRR